MAKRANELGGSLRYRTEQRAGATWIKLTGNLSEDADFSELKKLRGPLVLDLSEIGRINSLGVREWIYFVRACETAGVDLAFEKCAPVIVNQMGMISNFMGSRSRIKSVLTPYVCMSCNAEHLELLELAGAVDIPLTMPCSKCGANMEFDELVETYTGLFQQT